MSHFKNMFLPLVFITMFISAPVFAETKIGAVNINKLMEQAPQAQLATEEMKAQFSTRETELLAERDAIKSLEEEYKKNSDVISKTEKDNMEKKIRDRLRDFKRKSDTFTEDFSIARNEALKQIQTEVYKAIVELAETEKYDLIVSESVLYASTNVDITDKVLEKLKK